MLESKHIFISYKSQQRHLAFQIRDKLQEWGYETWVDVDRLQPGTYWANDIDTALKSCRACVGIMTPSAIKSRYVTNEWDMAIMKGKLYLPLMFEHTEPHYKYIDIQYVDFTSDLKDNSYSQLQSRLQNHNPASSDKPSDDPYHDYLQQLYDRINKYLSAKLITSLRDDEGRPEPIRLSSTRVDGAVNALFEKREEIDPLFAIGGIADESVKEFKEFSEAVKHFGGRILLLGEPGSGKTITLLQYARDAIVKRIQDKNAPLPVLAIIPTWNAYEATTISHWLANSYGSPHECSSLVEDGKAILFLDGLDELGDRLPVDPNQPDGPYFDPREKFIQGLPDNNHIILTCRVKDYHSIGYKAALRGAITLKALNQSQINAYLSEERELVLLLEDDTSLRVWLNTPLLLSFFAFAFQGMERHKIREILMQGVEGIKYNILNYYVEKCYEHENAKLQGNISHDLDEIYLSLGKVAMAQVEDWWIPNKAIVFDDFLPDDLLSADIISITSIIDLCLKIYLLINTQYKTYQFVHRIVRDHFALSHAILCSDNVSFQIRRNAAYVLGKLQDKRGIFTLIKLVQDRNVEVRYSAAYALSEIGYEALQPLIDHFSLFEPDALYSVAFTLGEIGHPDAIKSLESLLAYEHSNVRRSAVSALGKIGTLAVVNSLEKFLNDSNRTIAKAAYEALKHTALPEAIKIAETWKRS